MVKKYKNVSIHFMLYATETKGDKGQKENIFSSKQGMCFRL